MKVDIRKILVIALCLSGIFIMQCREAIAFENFAESELLSEIQEIKNEGSPNSQVNLTFKLANDFKRGKYPKVSKAEVHALASLLSLPNDAVRHWDAVALRYAGPNADRAVVALYVALAEIECSNASLTSEQAIRLTLKELRHTAPESKCSPF
ncbi:hypothetical protein [Asticcacaulis sp. AC460]|uniref:hypothetical protein n=1 Tax=Asticcacaulis sp. AC460 TaxID=1282360 RepID=UPI0012DC6B67|nr:hypothetical protein [Asticcacaulis sp. AC460]